MAEVIRRHKKQNTGLWLKEIIINVLTALIAVGVAVFFVPILAIAMVIGAFVAFLVGPILSRAGDS